MGEANFPAPAKGAGEPGNVQGVMRYPTPQTRNGSGLHSSGTEPRTPVLSGSIDTVPPQAPTEIDSTDPDWDEPGDVRGVIMYLPPKLRIRGSLLGQIEDIDDKVFDHPVVIQSMRRTEDTDTVCIFPITSHNKQGPYKPGKPGIPRFKECLPILDGPELQETGLSLDLSGGRATLKTQSGVRTDDTYTVPYQSLKYWHRANSISTSPRLKRHSYDKMMSLFHERIEKLKVIVGPNWRHGDDSTAPPPEMDPTSNDIENKVMSERAEKNQMSSNWREREPAPEGAERNKRSGSWRERGPTASRLRMESAVKTNGLSTLTTASTPTALSTPTTPNTLTLASTATTPVTPMSLPDSCTESSSTTPGSPSPLPSIPSQGRTFRVVRSSKGPVDARAALVRRPP